MTTMANAIKMLNDDSETLKNFVHSTNSVHNASVQTVYATGGIVYFYVAERETIYRMRYNLSRQNSSTGVPAVGEWDASHKARPGAEGIADYEPVPKQDLLAEIADRFTAVRNAALVLL